MKISWTGRVFRNLSCRLLITVVAILLCVTTLHASAVQETKTVLLLHSYHPGLRWTDDITASIEQTFKESGQSIALHVEYLDSKRNREPEYLNKYIDDLMTFKLDRAAFDLVIISDNNAFNFALKHRDDLFNGKPIVFCGVNGFDSTQIENSTDITGVAETPDLTANIELIQKLHPQVKELIVVGATKHPTGLRNYEHFRKIEPLFKGLHFEYVNDLVMEDLLVKLETLNPDQVVFTSLTIMGRDGHFYDFATATKLLDKACSVPIYAAWDFFLGHGIIGGKLLSGTAQGTQAAGMALDILNGAAPATLPVLSDVGSQYLFDYKKLQEFQVSINSLPEPHTIINQPTSAYSIDKKTIWGSLIFIVLSLLLSIILSWQILLRKKTERNLLASKARFKDIAMSMGDWVWEVDSRGVYQYSSEKSLELLGYTYKEILGKRPYDLMPTEQAKTAKLFMQGVIKGRKSFRDFENWNIHKNGSLVCLLTSGVPIFAEDGSYLGYRGVDKDITAEKATEAESIKRRAEFESIVNSISDAVVFTDPLRRLVMINPAFSKMFGYQSEELVGRTAECIYADPENFIAQGKHRFNRESNPEKSVFSCEYRRKDDTTFTGETLSAHVLDETGELIGFLGVTRDTTERKQAEEQLTSQRLLLEKSQELGHIGTWEFDRSRNSFTGTAEIARIFGVPDGSEVDFESFAQSIHPEDREHIGQKWDETLKGNPHHMEYRIIVDGATKWISAKAEVKLDKAGVVAKIIGATQDITQRKLAEDESKKERQRLGEILQGTNAGTWDWRIDTGELTINERWAEIIGYTLSEMEPVSLQTWRNTIHPEDLPAAEAALDKHFKGELDYYDVEFRQLHKDGNWVWVNARGKVVEWSANGQPLCLRGVHLDITARKQAAEENLHLERQVQHAQKLESLGVLAGGIAHDFNNILMGILGNAEITLRRLSPENPERSHIQGIIDAAVRAAELAKQMLAYSGKGRFVIEPINVNTMVTEITHLLQTTISKTAVLKFNLTENIPSIDCDVTQVRQVFMNLITNASEAIGEKSGVITVSTGVMEVTREYLNGVFVNADVEEGFYTFIEVSDTGCGMEKEVQEKIFDPFFTTKFTGRGLGMAATMGIIRGHKGAIKVYSEPGKGTTIKTLFPCTELPDIDDKSTGKANGKELPVDEQWQESGTILIVDDEESIRAVARMTLPEYGFEVLTAEDGRDGLAVFRENADDIKLVVLDMTMPHMGGEETFSEMRAFRPDVKVILSSGYNEEEATNRFAGKGLAGFIQKPYLPTELAKLLRETLYEEV